MEIQSLLHPYLIEKYYGLSSKGMLDVYRELQRLNGGEMGKLFISGYSEGGYGALATVKYLESHPEFNYVVKHQLLQLDLTICYLQA